MHFTSPEQRNSADDPTPTSKMTSHKDLWTMNSGFSLTMEYLRYSVPLIQVMGVFGAVALLLNQLFNSSEINPTILNLSVASCFTIFLMTGYVFMKDTFISVMEGVGPKRNKFTSTYSRVRDLGIILIIFLVFFVSLSICILFKFSAGIYRVVLIFSIIFMMIFVIAALKRLIRRYRANQKGDRTVALIGTLILIPSFTYMTYDIIKEYFIDASSLINHPISGPDALFVIAFPIFLLFIFDIFEMSEANRSMIIEKIKILIDEI